mmetsp:Transcript_32909/g.79996  ORF Transcript_32909/g.79996 Transcript_32909/m.79996 type:complete len:162 (-) Transcript_32909:1252-1737(-)
MPRHSFHLRLSWQSDIVRNGPVDDDATTTDHLLVRNFQVLFHFSEVGTFQLSERIAGLYFDFFFNRSNWQWNCFTVMIRKQQQETLLRRHRRRVPRRSLMWVGVTNVIQIYRSSSGGCTGNTIRIGCNITDGSSDNDYYQKEKEPTARRNVVNAEDNTSGQ